MSKTCPELLREAANLIEEALRRTPSSQPVVPSPRPVAPSSSPVEPSLRPVASSTSPVVPSPRPVPGPSCTPIRAEVARLFAPYNVTSRRNTLRRPAQSQIIRRSYTHTFCCLADHKDDKAPAIQLKQDLFASGLGEKKVTFTGNDNDPMVVTQKLMEVFPKLQEGGGFEFLKIAGSTRSRSLTLLQCPSTGYNLAYLKDPSTMIGQATIYIRPLQRDLPLDRVHENFGPIISCITCGKELPFSEMRMHRARCDGFTMQEEDREQEGSPAETREPAPVNDIIPVRPETSESSEGSTSVPVMTDTEEVDLNDWKLIKEPAQAAKEFLENLLREHASGKPLQLKMDLRDSEEDRERALLFFYKQQQEWACPLNCTLDGDAAIGQGVMRYFLTTVISKLQFGFSLNLGGTGRTVLFEGEPDHLVPSASEVLLESNLFQVAGRMLGHAFLHHGPRVTGLSPAVIHTLFSGDPEMATIVVEDCPDLHIRSIIQMLETEKLTQEQQDTVSNLCMSWDLPTVTKTNRRWLHNKLLVHAVIGRIMRQIKQLKKGLKDVMVWPLLTSRPDVVPLLFPRMEEMVYTPQMLLEKIKWPVKESDDEDEEFDVETKCCIAGFLRIFIETALSDTLAQLLRFWVGWEMLPPELSVEISGGALPTSVTCFETLKLPAHFNTYKDFEEALFSAINSTHTGFGLV